MPQIFACLGADGRSTYVDGELMKNATNCLQPAYNGLQHAAAIGIITIAIITIIITIVRNRKKQK